MYNDMKAQSYVERCYKKELAFANILPTRHLDFNLQAHEHTENCLIWQNVVCLYTDNFCYAIYVVNIS